MRADLQAALANVNVGAFLRVIRQKESSQDDSVAYRMMFGGQLFDAPPWQHPNAHITRNGITSTAAGAYQFLEKTWASLAAQFGFPDFSPASQDEGAVALIAGRHALQAVMEGQLDEAIRLCAKEWASLPGSPYGQPTQTLADCHEVFATYGGVLAGAAVPVAQDPQPQVQTPEVNVDPITIVTLLAEAGKYIPQLLDIFTGPGSAKDHNVAAAKVAADALVSVAAPNGDLYQAVSNISNDPAVAQQAKGAIADLWPTISEGGGGGVAGARDAVKWMDGDWRKLVFSLPFVGLVAIMPLVYAIVAASVFKAGWLVEVDDQLRGVVWGFVIGTGFGSIIGFIYGTSADSSKKTAALINK